MGKPSNRKNLEVKSDNPMISYCSTCMNRGEQLRQALKHNLEILDKYQGRIEMCLVNFIKDEEGESIHRWISNLAAPANFRYFVSRDLSAWHASVAKNTAHRVANGEYVINLDCDNFLDPSSIEALLEFGALELQRRVFTGFTGHFKKTYLRKRTNPVWRAITFNIKPLQPKYISLRSIRCRSGCDSNGTYGHIGMAKSTFMAIGGYDQSLPPMGGQDRDLLLRSLNYDRSSSLLQIPQTLLPIGNSKSDSLRHTDDPKADWKSLSIQAKVMTARALERSELVANSSEEIGVSCEAVFLPHGRPDV